MVFTGRTLIDADDVRAVISDREGGVVFIMRDGERIRSPGDAVETVADALLGLSTAQACSDPKGGDL